jgi:hypothetical protein
VARCGAELLHKEDLALLESATDIGLTVDGSGRDVVMRMRLVLGRVPQGLRPIAAEDVDGSRPVVGLSGRYIYCADRLLKLHVKGGSGLEEDATAIKTSLLAALQAACRGVTRGDPLGSRSVSCGDVPACRGGSCADGPAAALWDRVRRKVRVICPDSAADVQLAARLCADSFPGQAWVLRDGAHIVHGAMIMAWEAVPGAGEIDEIVTKIAKPYEVQGALRESSLRFGRREVGLGACEEL